MRLLSILALLAALAGQDSAVESWRNARVRPLLPDGAAHSIHSYYVATPESPDGRKVLFYSSTASDGHQGEIRVLERAGGAVKTLAANLVVEDAHRTACQQWISGGKQVAFHDFRDGEWVVACADLETGRERVLAKGR